MLPARQRLTLLTPTRKGTLANKTKQLHSSALRLTDGAKGQYRPGISYDSDRNHAAVLIYRPIPQMGMLNKVKYLVLYCWGMVVYGVLVSGGTPDRPPDGSDDDVITLLPR